MGPAAAAAKENAAGRRGVGVWTREGRNGILAATGGERRERG
uniref:Uncharacterized protein n=1 Tax=Arundo donax TaxID=35708 RepID=A0A0A9E678_ARUDO